MAGKLAEKRINNAGGDFRRCNGEFPHHTVGWGFHPNKKNLMSVVDWTYLPNNENAFALQNSCGHENLDYEQTVVTPLTHETETRMNSAFAGGGGI